MGLLPHLFGQMPHAQTTSNASDFGGHLLALALIRTLTRDPGNGHESQGYVISVTPAANIVARVQETAMHHGKIPDGRSTWFKLVRARATTSDNVEEENQCEHF